jgi:hypothetical protein
MSLSFLVYVPFLKLLTTVNENNFVPNAPLLLGRFPYIISLYLKLLVSMELRKNDTDRENQMYSKKNVSQRHLVHHKSHKE